MLSVYEFSIANFFKFKNKVKVASIVFFYRLNANNMKESDTF